MSESWAWQSLLVSNRSRSDKLLWFITYSSYWVHFGVIFVIPCKSRNDRIQKDAKPPASTKLSKTGHPMLGESLKKRMNRQNQQTPPSSANHPPSPTLRVLYLHESIHPDYVAPPVPQRFQRPTVTPEGQEIPQVRQPRPKVYDPAPCFFWRGWGVQLLLRYMGMLCRSVCM